MAVKTELSVGDRAPSFKVMDEQGKMHSSSDYVGKTLVLYFYPKDDTSGCTAEACDFRDSYNKYAKKGLFILGVSPDDAKSHLKFSQKNNLPFPLICDTDKKLCEAFGVWKSKTMYGRKYMGVERSTFVINREGRIEQAHRKVAVPGHVDAILKSL